MLTPEDLQEFINKYQTNKKNIVREYIQHLFLSALYRANGAEKLLFKGGTALRIVFQSPRFSEDLDFTGLNIFNYREIDDLFISALAEVEKYGINITYKEAKPTTGGYLGLIHYSAFDVMEDMKFEVSLRKRREIKGELTNIALDYAPPYTIVHVPPKELIDGKMAALLDRHKPRDYYDLYFILRHHQLNQAIGKSHLRKVVELLEKEKINFKSELSVLLPASHQLILKNFKNILRKEIGKYL
ncbi:nucleotidyl transferase AbiEii/AbiGii toxin family protein [Candidatus Saganbacteria bacterium]|nr:nucleotidyl transferase AbiEii/AbiGii toxin family protein [Candidatus Saganbacteria bacterium]